MRPGLGEILIFSNFWGEKKKKEAGADILWNIKLLTFPLYNYSFSAGSEKLRINFLIPAILVAKFWSECNQRKL